MQPNIQKFMHYLGHSLQKELANDKGISFIPSDSYRRILPLTQIYKTKKIYSTQPSSKILRFFKGIRGLAKKDLQQLDTKASPKTLEKLRKLWEKTKNYIRLLIKKYMLPFIRRDQTIEAFLQAIKKTKDWENFQSDWHKAIIFEVTNTEMLFNIFLTTAKHVILYAGVAHTREIAQFLEEQLGFKLVINVGLKESPQQSRFSLAPTAWNFLIEKPSLSLRRGLKQALETEAIYYDIIRQKNSDKFNDALKRGFQAHLDIANLQSNQGKTLLHRFTFTNKLDFVNILLTHGAMINTQDIFGNTPLHIAALINNLPIAKALLAHGANRTIKNKYGKTAADIARLPELKKLLE